MNWKRIANEIERRPFRPFLIVLDNGEEVPVEHAENLQRVSFNDFHEFHAFSEEKWWVFEASAVSEIRSMPRRRGRRRR